ncbi:MAG: UDP-N-acetylmuramoyl-L-alanyl-D-glutamate--2,6-diaminopimelate ligase, partial [Paracoccaceae bacterium]
MTERRSFADLGLMEMPRRGARADAATPVGGLRIDSRAVGSGDLFVAIPGTRIDGAEFAQFAVRQGAVGVVATEAGAARLAHDLGGLPVPVFLDPEPRRVLARLAGRFWPAAPAVIAAVTGTNGKTSTVHFLRQIWAHAGHPAASLGTTGISAPGFAEPLQQTTPDALVIHERLADLAARGVTHAAIEASSHGLAQYRLDGLLLSAGGLSNITRDHLDYHPSFEDYVAAKLRLFRELLPLGATAVLNADDPAFAEAREAATARGLRILTVGRAETADLRITQQRYLAHGQLLGLAWEGVRHDLELRLVGAFQAENVALAAGLALATEIPARTVFAALPDLTGVRGRMERVATRANGAAIFVDYAHTPDALASAVDALRPHIGGRLVVVFGAGGDRDPGKRPEMGAAVATRADLAIVTDDNPRSEDPAAIRGQVMAGCPDATEIAGRAEAILAGVDALDRPEDGLLIAVKGHETGQEIAGTVHPFDDAEQARAAVGALDAPAWAD